MWLGRWRPPCAYKFCTCGGYCGENPRRFRDIRQIEILVVTRPDYFVA
ncbi:hypothetical protein FHX58_007638, partial [Paraburkholderia tropica]|nr:hypothetical protein [Paraburkholderia tropica]